MKKITSFSLTVYLLLASGCQTAGPGATSGDKTASTAATGKTETAQTAAPFNMDYDTEANLDFFTKPESLELLASGGPYYISPETLPMPAFTEFNKLKQAKVDEAMKITGELMDGSQKLMTKIRTYEAPLYNLIGTVGKEDSRYGKLATENIAERASYASKELLTMAYIRSLPGNADDPYITAGANYHASMLALELGTTLLDDYTSLLLNAAQMDALLESSTNENIKAALAEFNKGMEAAGDAKTDIESIIAKTAALDTSLRQLSTAEYYMAKTGIEYLKSEIPKAKAALETIKASEDFSEEDITFAKDFIAVYEEVTADMESKLDTIADKDQLLLPGQSALLPVAHADFWSFYESAKSTLSSGASAIGSGISTTAEYGWAATKKTVRAGQRLVGTTVEGVGTITKSTFDFYSGLYYGNSLADIKQRQNQNYSDWWDKTKNGTAGAETLDLGGKILEESENIVSGIITAPIKYTWGEGYVSWAVGGVSKIAAGVFTSLGKGIFKLSNPQSTKEDMFWGAFDLATSLIGGSSSVIKASQATKGAYATAKNFVDQGATFLAKILGKSKSAKLAERMEEITALLKKGGLDKDVKAALKKELKQTRYEINRLKNVENTLKATSETLQTEVTEGVKNARGNLKDLVKGNLKEQGENVYKTFTEDIESSVLGYIKKFLEPIKSPFDLFDGYVHGELDKFLAGLGKDFLAQTVIPWLEGNYDGVYSGEWKTQAGTFPVAVTVSGGKISGEGTINLSYGGVSMSSKISISGAVDAEGGISGTMSQSGQIGGALQGSGGGSGSFGGNIKKGVMTMNYSGSGSTTVSAQGYTTTASGGDSGTIVMTRQL